MEVIMKKWHLEGLLYHISPEKLVLPDPGQPVSPRSSFLTISKEPKIVSWCREVVAFFIRFF